MIKLNRLEQRLLRLSRSAVQGGLSLTTRTCGVAGCACRSDPARRHGPHLYLTFKTPDGRSSGFYVSREHEKRVRRAVADWARLWETLVVIGRRNRQALHRSIRARGRKRA